MNQSVIIFGAGIAGLTAAHELSERGFKVTIYEKNSFIGGKAASYLLPGQQHPDRLYPGEHGYRFFFEWYENLQDTLQRIPCGNRGTVADQLIPVKEILIDNGILPLTGQVTDARPPLAWIKTMLSCRQRLDEEYETLVWDDFIKDATPSMIDFLKNAPKVVGSLQAHTTSVRAVTHLLNRSVRYPAWALLNGPTSTIWFDHWETMLKKQGVRFCYGYELTHIEMTGNNITAAGISGKDGPAVVQADEYIVAIPHKKLENTFSPDQLNNIQLASLADLTSSWEAGLVLYLRHPLHIPCGSFGFPNTPWAISGVQQSDYWNKAYLQDYTILSVVIADWNTPGDQCKKSARTCIPSELVAELIFQLAHYAPEEWREQFAGMEIMDYTIDPGLCLTGNEKARNETPFFVNTVNSWRNRPDSGTVVKNLHIAGDFTKTSTYLANMEAANESGRLAANSVIRHTGGTVAPCKVFTEKHHKTPLVFQPFLRLDETLYLHHKKHIFDYLDETQASLLTDKLMPYVYPGSPIPAQIDGVYECLLMLTNIMQQQLPDVPTAILPMHYGQHHLLGQQLSNSVRQWSGVNMLLVDHMPTHFPDSLHAYIDTGNPIFKPLLHIVKEKGAMHRAKFAIAINEWYGVPAAQLSHMLEVGQCLHNCSLLIDDIMDNTIIRREQKTAHEIFGTNHTFGAAYTTTFQLLLSCYINLGEKCLVYFVEEMARAHVGQTEEIYFRESRSCPSEEKYMDIIRNKTGSFFRIAVTCMQALSTHRYDKAVNEQLLEIADQTGLLFQLRDDYLDLVSTTYFQKKGTIASDFEEGKYSYPVVHCLQHYPEYREIFRNTLGKTDITLSEKKQLIDILEKTGSLQHTLYKIKTIYTQVCEQIHTMETQLHISNNKLFTWINKMMEDTPGFNMPDTLISPAPALHTRRLKKNSLETIDLSYMNAIKVVRDTLCSYVAYFSRGQRTTADFWKCFPLLVVIQAQVFQVDDENETHHRAAPSLTHETFRQSAFWKMVFNSSLCTPDVSGALDEAVEFFRLEQEWYRQPEKMLDIPTLKFMTRCKSICYRLHHFMSRNVLEEMPVNTSYDILEDYISLCTEEMQAADDAANGIYNVLLHSQAIDNGQLNLFTTYKEELAAQLTPEQLLMAAEWVSVHRKAIAYQAAGNTSFISLGISALYACARKIADKCAADEELADFTLKGNFSWCVNMFFDQSAGFGTSDNILRKLQQETMLSLQKEIS